MGRPSAGDHVEKLAPRTRAPRPARLQAGPPYKGAYTEQPCRLHQLQTIILEYIVNILI